MELRVAFGTLGCKLNQLESESLADAFRRVGARLVPLEDEAELFVLNTCTVTAKAERTARRLIRQALAANPAAVVLATGCYAELEAEALAAIDDRVLVLPGGAKAAILALAAHLKAAAPTEGFPAGGLFEAVRGWLDGRAAASAAGRDDPFAFEPEAFGAHSRPSLKVQDGCDRACAYCRVRLARGPSRSLPAELALERLQVLEAGGAAEVVLTGVNLSQYRDGGGDFPGLLRFLLAGTRRVALRLSSYEPDRVDAAFLEVFSDPRLRPHAHLAIQSGSDAILRSMGRPYGRAEVLRAAASLRRVKGDPFLAADFIVGFPGETEADFAESLALAEEAGLAWIHAFPFSPRPGTAAWTMAPRVPDPVARARAGALATAARRGRLAYARRWGGREVEAVVERGGGTDPSWRRATSENYLKLRVLDLPDNLSRGTAFSCRLEDTLPAAAPSPSLDPEEVEAGFGEGTDLAARFLRSLPLSGMGLINLQNEIDSKMPIDGAEPQDGGGAGDA